MPTYPGIITLKSDVDPAMLARFKKQWAAAIASSPNGWRTPIITTEEYTWSVDYAAPNIRRPDAEWY